MINVKELVKYFGQRRAVDGVTFDVEKGIVLGFLGPNGAGKTTTIRVLAGFLAPTSGDAIVHGCSVVDKPVEAQRHVGYMPETAPLYDDMTVETFMRFIAEIRGFSGSERNQKADRVIDMCFLGPVKHQVIDTLSKGYRQRTCFAQALIHDPPILLLDEPTEGLDPNQKQVVRDMIQTMSAEKVIMLSTHVLEEVEAICSRVIIISSGKIVSDSNPKDLKKQSKSFNTLHLTLAAPSEEARNSFGEMADVKKVEITKTDADKVSLLLTPKNKQALAAGALELAQNRNWKVIELHTDSGRLDEIFREITTTEDVA